MNMKAVVPAVLLSLCMTGPLCAGDVIKRDAVGCLTSEDDEALNTATASGQEAFVKVLSEYLKKGRCRFFKAGETVIIVQHGVLKKRVMTDAGREYWVDADVF